jgi:hypothetical protein
MKLAVQYGLMCWHAFGQWKNFDVGAILRHLIKIQRTPIHGPRPGDERASPLQCVEDLAHQRRWDAEASITAICHCLSIF